MALNRTIDGMSFAAGNWPLDPKLPTLLFVHGSGGSSGFWSAQVEGLSGVANTLAVDLPGHGASGGEGCALVSEYAAWVAGFTGALDLSRPIVCGLSLGGAVALQSILDYPDLYRGGILISTGARLKVLPLILETIRKDFQGFVSMLDKFAVAAGADPALVRPVMEDTARQRPEVVHGDFTACDRFDVCGRLSEIKLPVLVVTAEEDKLTPEKYGIFLQKGIEGARRIHVAGAGHMVPIEKPDDVNQAIADFLAGLNETTELRG